MPAVPPRKDSMHLGQSRRSRGTDSDNAFSSKRANASLLSGLRQRLQVGISALINLSGLKISDRTSWIEVATRYPTKTARRSKRYSLKKVVSSLGRIDVAPTRFETCPDVSVGGVVRALPALAENGLFRHIHDWLSGPRPNRLAQFILVNWKLLFSERDCKTGQYSE